MKLGVKIAILILLGCCSIAGFMLKLPLPFRKMDKEMHTIFYCAASLFINLLFLNKNILVHFLITGILYCFGYVIEHAQSYSNRFFKHRIHGNFDPEDVTANVQGLLYASIVWIALVIIYTIFKQFTKSNVT